MLNSVSQKPIEGTSIVYSFEDAKAPTKASHAVLRDVRQSRHLQRRLGRRHDPGRPGPPWIMGQSPDVDDYRWELYNVTDDFSQAVNLADKEPAKLRELQDLFWHPEAAKYNEGSRSTTARSSVSTSAIRPSLTRGRSVFTSYAGQDAYPRRHGAGPEEQVVPDWRRCGYSRRRPADGVIATQGGRFNGWGLYLLQRQAGVPLSPSPGVQRFTVAGKEKLAPGKHVVVVDFKYDGGGIGKGATVTVSTLTIGQSPKAAWTVHMPFASRSTRPSTSARTPAHPSARIITCSSSSPVN